MDTNVKRYVKEFGSAMATYAIAVPASIRLLNGHQHSSARYLVALLPVIPSAFAMWAAIRFFQRA